MFFVRLGLGLGGVGWDDNVLCLRTHGRCHATVMLVERAHMVDATQHVGWGGVGCDDICCTWSMLRNMWGGVGCDDSGQRKSECRPV